MDTISWRCGAGGKQGLEGIIPEAEPGSRFAHLYWRERLFARHKQRFFGWLVPFVKGGGKKKIAKMSPQVFSVAF